MARVDVSASARDDLVELVETIAKDSPLAARRMRDRIVERFASVAEQPGLGSPHDILRPGLRGNLVGPYWIFYVGVADGVRIVRILHGRRDWQRLLATPLTPPRRGR